MAWGADLLEMVNHPTYDRCNFMSEEDECHWRRRGERWGFADLGCEEFVINVERWECGCVVILDCNGSA